MDGQNGGYRPRTAGERSNAPGGDGVRDWQRNTWFGPAPVNPFDEPEDAPELIDSRSENVTEHAGDFWIAPGAEPQNRNTGSVSAVGGAAPKKEKATGRKKALRIAAGTVLFVVSLLLVLRFAVFSVKEIVITGNDQISAEEVIRISGLRRGANILTINEDEVRDRILSDYRLQFRYIAREMPGTVVISVREREACCWLSYCGIIYVMDKNRMVMFESENPADKPLDLVEIKGLEVRSNTIAGQYMTLGSEIQQSVFRELFLEMKVLGCTDRIAEADISNPDAILLSTRDGFTVSMGSRDNIHAKLRSMILVQDELIRMGSLAGTINVSNPEGPIYTP